MDLALAMSMIGALYPPLKDFASSRQGKPPGKYLEPNYQHAISEIIKLAKKDISTLRRKVEALQTLAAELDIPINAPGSIFYRDPPHGYPHDKWRYRRAREEIDHLCVQFEQAITEIMSIVACQYGILTLRSIQELDEMGMLDLSFQKLLGMVRSHRNYSINDLTQAMLDFLTECQTVFTRATT